MPHVNMVFTSIYTSKTNQNYRHSEGNWRPTGKKKTKIKKHQKPTRKNIKNQQKRPKKHTHTKKKHQKPTKNTKNQQKTHTKDNMSHSPALRFFNMIPTWRPAKTRWSQHPRFAICFYSLFDFFIRFLAFSRPNTKFCSFLRCCRFCVLVFFFLVFYRVLSGFYAPKPLNQLYGLTKRFWCVSSVVLWIL